jgi:hypothetical protein
VAEKLGIPSVTLAATTFLPLVVNTGKSEGVSGLRFAEYPGTWSIESVATMRENFKKMTFDQVIKALTQESEKIEVEAEVKGARDIVFEGTLEEVNNFFHANMWSDGMAIIPPTIERVEEFLKYTDIPPDKEIAILPVANLRATPWNIAVNGVMAGCKPEYMPILIAIVEAINAEAYNLSQLGSTGAFTPYLILNGPVARQLGFEHGQGVISGLPNQAVGRALGLMIRNIANYRIKVNYMGTFGYLPPFVIAEDEERSPWEPLHVEKGFDRNVSTVTASSSDHGFRQTFPSGNDVEGIIEMIAYDIISGRTLVSVETLGGEGTFTGVFLTPPVAKLIADGGYSKEDFKNALAKSGRAPVHECALEVAYSHGTGEYFSFEDAIKCCSQLPGVEIGKNPRWYVGPDPTIPLINKDKVRVVVTGDPTRNKEMHLHGATWYQGFITQEIKLPAHWDELIAKAGYHPLKEFFLKK